MDYLLIISVFLGVIILVMAVIAIYQKNLVVAIIAAGAAGLFASIMYLLLAAPDVAMTEAAIGSGLSTFIFFYVLNRIRSSDEKKPDSVKSDQL
jgi:uncharacterized MnhB-related membrane protein